MCQIGGRPSSIGADQAQTYLASDEFAIADDEPRELTLGPPHSTSLTTASA
jgi:hypothetical protein